MYDSADMMSEPLDLTPEQIPVVLHYITEEIRNCESRKEGEPDNWIHEFVPPLEALKARIEANPEGPITISPEEGEAISMLAQDVVSFRAGPCGEDEEIFFKLLNQIEGAEDDEDDEE